MVELSYLLLQSTANLAGGVGFEPTELLHSTDFKSAAISQTLPTAHNLWGIQIHPYTRQFDLNVNNYFGIYSPRRISPFLSKWCPSGAVVRISG